MGICQKKKNIYIYIFKRLRRWGDFGTLSAKFYRIFALIMPNWGKEKRETLTTNLVLHFKLL